MCLAGGWQICVKSQHLLDESQLAISCMQVVRIGVILW